VELVRDESGLPLHIQSVARDISERKQTEEQLRKLSHAVEQSPTSIVITDLHGNIEYVNPKFCETTGYAPSEAIGQNPRILKSGELSGAIYQQLWRALSSGQKWHGEFHNRKKNGELFWELAAIAPVRNSNGQITHFVAVKEDITERKQAEEALRRSNEELLTTQKQLIQQERLAAVGQLAAGIAHDFNNILAVILLYAQMMNRSSHLPPWETEAVVTIEKQTKTAAQLVQQILDFSRRSMMEKRTLDWLPLLKEQVRLLRHTLPDNITVTLQTGAGGPFMVCADAARLQQMLLNLAVNARDAMPDGGELRLELDKLDLAAAQDSLLAGSWLRLRVSDTGQGITPEDSQHIFEPFFTTKPPGQGSGLGLSQAQGIVLQHDGGIEFTTEIGQGTAFTIYLPAVAGEAELVAAPAAAQSGQRETVLLVEDNDIVRQALVASLQALNYEVTAVSNGREALDYLQANPDQVDAILSDMIMPIMGGAELFRQVQRLARPIPMIIITGHRMNEELDSLVTQGLVGWLMKPVNLDGLADLLEQALRRTAGQSR
jgi:PAS domain S-box-containing protein